MNFLEHIGPSGAVTMIVGCKPKTTLVYAPGRTVKERTPKSYTTPGLLPRCLSTVPRRIHDPLGVNYSSISNAGEFEETIYQERALVGHPNARR